MEVTPPASPLRRATYVRVEDLTGSYDIDPRLLRAEIAKAIAVASTAVGLARGTDGDGGRKNSAGKAEEKGGRADKENISSGLGGAKGQGDDVKIETATGPLSGMKMSGGGSVGALGVTTERVPYLQHQKRLHPPRGGFNLCALVGKVKVVVDKLRVDRSRVRLAEVEVGDETGVVSLRARDGQIDVLQEISNRSGAVVLRNCTLELYQGRHLRLAVTKWGKLAPYPDGVASTPHPPGTMNRDVDFSLVDLNLVANDSVVRAPPSPLGGGSMPASAQLTGQQLQQSQPSSYPHASRAVGAGTQGGPTSAGVAKHQQQHAQGKQQAQNVQQQHHRQQGRKGGRDKKQHQHYHQHQHNHQSHKTGGTSVGLPARIPYPEGGMSTVLFQPPPSVDATYADATQYASFPPSPHQPRHSSQRHHRHHHVSEQQQRRRDQRQQQEEFQQRILLQNYEMQQRQIQQMQVHMYQEQQHRHRRMYETQYQQQAVAVAHHMHHPPPSPGVLVPDLLRTASMDSSGAGDYAAVQAMGGVAEQQRRSMVTLMSTTNTPVLLPLSMGGQRPPAPPQQSQQKQHYVPASPGTQHRQQETLPDEGREQHGLPDQTPTPGRKQRNENRGGTPDTIGSPDKDAFFTPHQGDTPAAETEWQQPGSAALPTIIGIDSPPSPPGRMNPRATTFAPSHEKAQRMMHPSHRQAQSAHFTSYVTYDPAQAPPGAMYASSPAAAHQHAMYAPGVLYVPNIQGAAVGGSNVTDTTHSQVKLAASLQTEEQRAEESTGVNSRQGLTVGQASRQERAAASGAGKEKENDKSQH